MTNKYYAAALLASAALLPQLARAQDGAKVQQKAVGADGQPTLVAFSAAARATLSATNAAQVLRQQLPVGRYDELRAARFEADPQGFTHQRFEQYYRGVKVEHASYTVHARQNQVQSISGDFEAVDEQLSVQPTLGADAALSRALASIGARRYMWQEPGMEAFLQKQTGRADASYRPSGELVLVRDNRQSADNTGPLVLAWKFNIYAAAPLSRAYYYVHAQTGEVVLRDDIIKHAGATASFATAYSGTRSLATETTTGGYRLREYTRGNGIETYNLKTGTNYSAAVDFVDADNNWTAAEYNNAAYDNVAGDAHFGAQSTYDYWKEVHARNSYDNAGAKIKSYVHYSKSYENAYWDGTEMTYGDGATTFKPLTALDVCGHEIGHAVCEHTANLTYSNESGAMNEGFSDCWGASVEKYTVDKLGLTGKSTWDIGEEIMKAGGALRSMSNPNLYGQPAYYKGKNWYSGTSDNGGVHTNSGVLNYWYYLVAVGKSGTNEAGNSFSVTGLGLGDAAKILFRTESVYLTASSTYANARIYSIQAATDLFGATSTQTQAVTNAWYAVGIGAAYGSTTPPPTTTAYCTSKGGSQAYEYIDYVKLGSLARTSGADGGYYDGTASSTSVAAGSSQTISFSAGFKSTAYTEYWKIYIDYNQDGDFGDAGETVVSGSSKSTGTLTSTFTVPASAKTGKTRLRVVMSDASTTTSCGSYSYGETEDYSLSITGGAAVAAASQGIAAASAVGGDAVLSLYPNPAASVVTLELSSGAELRSVEVFDALGKLAPAARYQGGSQLDVSGLAGGLYLLRATDGARTYVQRFTKQ
ncbi:T9SS type A sorting domain-containing protein [Hymenobacter sp. RP-2-7]|uniref:T9SS type A sorting domain-containing protein n=1 Tax=Hymenobacter polaris TaxID=2682546 RepID=A0A7Y0AFE0_9BACT|nr:M4 family metallopeptidase [Hymenobacter polaris]NML66291.1 T9SS type A sorting domain-containing protein [Hymenobacter polaris]